MCQCCNRCATVVIDVPMLYLNVPVISSRGYSISSIAISRYSDLGTLPRAADVDITSQWTSCLFLYKPYPCLCLLKYIKTHMKLFYYRVVLGVLQYVTIFILYLKMNCYCNHDIIKSSYWTTFNSKREQPRWRRFYWYWQLPL